MWCYKMNFDENRRFKTKQSGILGKLLIHTKVKLGIINDKRSYLKNKCLRIVGENAEFNTN